MRSSDQMSAVMEVAHEQHGQNYIPIRGNGIREYELYFEVAVERGLRAATSPAGRRAAWRAVWEVGWAAKAAATAAASICTQRASDGGPKRWNASFSRRQAKHVCAPDGQRARGHTHMSRVVGTAVAQARVCRVGAHGTTRDGGLCIYGCGLGGCGLLWSSPSQPDQVPPRPPLGGTLRRHEALEGRWVAASLHWTWGADSSTLQSGALTRAASSPVGR